VSGAGFQGRLAASDMSSLSPLGVCVITLPNLTSLGVSRLRLGAGAPPRGFAAKSP
jgi:hypothetical protein